MHRTFADAKSMMIEQHLKARGILHPKVIMAMQTVPREAFVSLPYQGKAYADHPLPIEENQTISQPYIVAWMAQILDLQPEDKVLEIGTGSGYSAAVLSQIAKYVYGVEYFSSLVELSRERLESLGYKNISIKQGDGSVGWKVYAPYQAISVTAAATEIPTPLLEQLAIHGKLVMPVGRAYQEQELICVTKKSSHNYQYTVCGRVVFVPLLGSGYKTNRKD